jgi:hypothetical protein
MDCVKNFLNVLNPWFLGLICQEVGKPRIAGRTISVSKTSSTVAIHTGVFARWIAFIGYAFALFLLLSGRYVQWTVMVFPLWVLLVSIDILIDNVRQSSQTKSTERRL